MSFQTVASLRAGTAPLVQRFALNTAGRDLIVGDVHGCFTKLRAALAAVDFDPALGDRLFSVGDLVDRGPESAHALAWLDEPWFHAVRGNHEDMAMRWPGGSLQGGVFVRNMDPGNYAANGGAWNIGNTTQESQRFADAFSALPVAIEVSTDAGLVAVVHADCPCRAWADFTAALETGWVRGADGTLSQSPREVDHLIMMAQWSRDRADKLFDGEVEGVRAVVVGHTPMERATSLGNVLFIDTGAWLGQPPLRPFTILDAKTLRHAEPRSKLQW
jgi:serine/threonine protein phosphatase 1